MSYVITREIAGVKHYYAGYVSEWSPAAFMDSGPVWNRTITRYARLEEPVADAVKKQLIEMGYAVDKELIFDKPRKVRGKRA